MPARERCCECEAGRITCAVCGCCKRCECYCDYLEKTADQSFCECGRVKSKNHAICKRCSDNLAGRTGGRGGVLTPGVTMLGRWTRPLTRQPDQPAVTVDDADVPTHSELPMLYTIIGQDLGQATDYATAVAFQRDLHERDGPVTMTGVRRWPRDYDYMQLASDTIDLPGDCIAPEYNHAGRPFVDRLRQLAMERQRRVKILPVTTVSARSRESRVKRGLGGMFRTIPKQQLVSGIRMLWPRVKLLDCEEVRILKQEMADFELRHSELGTPQFGNRPGAGRHDDLVIAFGIAAWLCLTRKGRRPAIYMP